MFTDVSKTFAKMIRLAIVHECCWGVSGLGRLRNIERACACTAGDAPGAGLSRPAELFASRFHTTRTTRSNIYRNASRIFYGLSQLRLRPNICGRSIIYTYLFNPAQARAKG